MDSEPFSVSDCWEWRRMQAWQLKQLGWKQRDIATALAAFASLRIRCIVLVHSFVCAKFGTRAA